MSETVYYGSDNLVGIGNVGIGTTNPSRILHVYGVQPVFALQASTAVAGQDPAFILYNSAGSSKASLGYSISGDYTYYLSDTINRQIIIYDTTSPYGTGIHMIGNVGIGTATPVSPFTVQGSSDLATFANLSLDYPNSKKFSILYKDPVGDSGFYYSTFLGKSLSTNGTNFTIHSDGTNRFMSAIELGNAGINFYSNLQPNVITDQTGISMAQLQNSRLMRLIADFSTSSSPILTLSSGSRAFPVSLMVTETAHATSKRASIQIGENSASWQLLQDMTGNGTRNFAIYGNGATRLAILTDGKVGIGTTDPQATVDIRNKLIVGDFGSAGFYNSNAAVHVRRSGVNPHIIMENINAQTSAIACLSGGVVYATDAANGYHAFKNNWTNSLDAGSSGTERMRINSTGVGIGTTSPAYSMDIFNNTISGTVYPTMRLQGNGGSGTQTVIDMSGYAGRTGGPSARIAALDDNYSTHLVFSTAAGGSVGANFITERMRVTTGGAVAVQVTGNIRQSSLPVLSVYKSGGTQSVNGTVVVFDGTIYNTQWTLTSTSRFTLTGPSGYYLIYARLQTPGSGTNLYLGVAIRVNGVDRAIPYTGKPSSTAYVSVQSQVVTFLNTNDYIEVWGLPSNAVNIESSASSDARTSLQAVYLSGQ